MDETDVIPGEWRINVCCLTLSFWKVFPNRASFRNTISHFNDLWHCSTILIKQVCLHRAYTMLKSFFADVLFPRFTVPPPVKKIKYDEDGWRWRTHTDTILTYSLRLLKQFYKRVSNLCDLIICVCPCL